MPLMRKILYGDGGTNYGGGIDLKEDEIVETPIKYVENVKSVSLHWGFNIILKTDGSLWIYGDNANSETAYTCYPTGINLTDLPYKLMDNVNSISEWTSSGSQRTLVLDNEGKLFEFNITEYSDEHTPDYELNYIADNIKLKEDDLRNDTKEFTDITDKSAEAQKAVVVLTRAGIIRGVSDMEFAPDAAVTRAEAAALLLRMTAQSDADGNGGFSDVTEDMWYYDTAGASKKYGIISGFEDNTFRGGDRISKVQLISLAARALKNERNVTASEAEFSYDAPEWAAEDIATAHDSGLITENDLLNLNAPYPEPTRQLFCIDCMIGFK